LSYGPWFYRQPARAEHWTRPAGPLTERSSQGTTIHSLPGSNRQGEVDQGRHTTKTRVDLTPS